MEDKYQDINPGDLTITAGGERAPYVKLAEGEPLQAHISNVKKFNGTKFGEPETPQTQLVVSYTIDEEEGQGQVYNAYYTPTLGSDDKPSNLRRVVIAALGNTPSSLDATELVGKMVRITLEPHKSNPDRQNVSKVSILKPAKNQTIAAPSVDGDAVLTEADFNNLFN